MWYNIPVIKKELKTVNLPCLSMDRVKMSDPSPEYFSKHCHDRYEYIFFVQADCEYVVESKVYRVRSGDSILIPPGSPSNTVPMAGPWLSPNNVTVTAFPNVFFIRTPPGNLP